MPAHTQIHVYMADKVEWTSECVYPSHTQK